MKDIRTIVLTFFIGLLFCTCTDTAQRTNERPPINRTQHPPPPIDPTEQRKPSSPIEELVTSFEREVWSKPNMVISGMGSLADKTIADIGAGYGYFSFRLLKDAKKVLAIDIDPEAIAFIENLKKELPDSTRNRLETRICQPDDPNLRPGEADIVLLVNTYIYIENRIDYLKNLQKGMAPNGRILIIDFKKKNIPIPIAPSMNQRLSISDVESELESAGFIRIKTDDTSLDYQYTIMAQVP